MILNMNFLYVIYLISAPTLITVKNAESSGAATQTTSKSKQTIVCSRISITNGISDCPADLQVGTTCNHRCNIGHKLIGTNSSTCAVNGTATYWLPALPNCQDQCPSFSVINGETLCTNGVNVNSTCSHQCEPDYDITGANISICVLVGLTARWIPVLPQCQGRCPPISITNGRSSTCSRNLKIGSICTHQCVDGYGLIGSDSSTCILSSADNAYWEPLLPMCQDRCPVVTNGNGRSSTCTRDVNVGSTCTHQCSNAYELIGSASSVCTLRRNTANWVPSLPTCLGRCLSVSITNGGTSCSNDLNALSRCNHECNEGYRLIGSSYSLCTLSGITAKWMPTLPRCREITVTRGNCNYYFSSGTARSYDQASSRCRSRGNRILAFLKTSEITSFAQSEISRIYSTDKSYFIGARKNNNFWMWNDSDMLVQSPTGSATSACATFHPVQGIVAVSCFSTQGYICERSLSSPCSVSPCENGGTCTPVGCSFLCKCMTNFFGFTCSTQQLEISSEAKHTVVQGGDLLLSYGIRSYVNGSYNCQLSEGPTILQQHGNLENRFIFQYTITNIQTSAVYVLSCNLMVDDQMIEQTFQTMVAVKVPATVTISQSSIEVIRNTSSTVIVNCVSFGNPRPTGSWLNDDVVISSSQFASVYQMATVMNSTTIHYDLILTKAHYSDSGTYMCKASNKFANASRTLVVLVAGAPEILASTNYIVSPVGNKVEFTCIFDGFPLPNVIWKFSNDSAISQNSQFQVGSQRSVMRFRVLRSLTVFGVQCTAASQFSFKCSATNPHMTAPTESNIFFVDIGTQYIQQQDSCQSAVDQCRRSGGNLTIVTNQEKMNRINQIAGRMTVSRYWISSESIRYFSSWDQYNFSVTNSEGCIRVNQPNNQWALHQNQLASPICENYNTPQTMINVTKFECDGRKINITWNILAGSASFHHRISISNLPDMISRPGTKHLSLTNLLPRTEYIIKIAPLLYGCENDITKEGTKVVTGRGNVTAPASVRLQFVSSNRTCIVLWMHPQTNVTEIGSFHVKIIPLINQKRQQSLQLLASSNVSRTLKSVTQFVIRDLQPNTNYMVQVGAAPSTPCDGKIPIAWSDSIGGVCVTMPSGPGNIELSATPPTTSANGLVTMTLDPVSERNGLISCYILVVQKLVSTRNHSVTTEISKLKQAGGILSNGDAFIAIAMKRFGMEMEVHLGNADVTCCDVNNIESPDDCSSQTESGSRKQRAAPNVVHGQNRPLEPGSNYIYYVITSTPNDNTAVFSASPQSQPFVHTLMPTDSSNTGLIIGIIMGLVVIVIICIIFFVLYKRRLWIFKDRKSYSTNDYPMQTAPNVVANLYFNSREDSFESIDQSNNGDLNDIRSQTDFSQFLIYTDDLLSVYKLKKNGNDCKFAEEFSTLSSLVAKQNIVTNCANLPENHKKNRFKNILPCDHSRVKLKKSVRDPCSDYINASFIDGYNQAGKFIATQGPKPNTTNDFWRMVFENHCAVIAMVTRIKEGYKVKCEKYWPDLGEIKDYGNITVQAINQITYGRFFCTNLTATNNTTNEKQDISHFQYLDWPDHGIPLTTSTLLQFHKTVLNANPGNSGPIVVHCSAGVGRTGTFIALDILRDQLACEQHINVFETVYRMRMNRTDMVQNLGQYAFTHKLITEVKLFGDTDVDVTDFLCYETNLHRINPASSVTGMESQFCYIGEVPPSFTVTTVANKPANKHLNADSTILPYDNNLSFVRMTSDDNEVPYINASNIPSYYADFYFITAQDPVPSNIHLFWRCIIDNKLKCIVMLAEDENFTKYWPDRSCHGTFHNISVNTTSITECSGYTERKLEVFKDDETEPFCVEQIVLQSWPRNGIPQFTSSFLQIMFIVEKCFAAATYVRGKKFVALIHCKDGSSQAGTFCTILNLLDRLKNENKIDVFRAVKDVRDLRYQAISDIEKYKFCYKTVRQFIQSFDLYGNFK